MSFASRFPPLAVALVVGLSTLASLAMTAPQASAHCQVPCGIYDDHARVDAMLEDVTTIAKAVMMITALASKTDAKSINQRVRWINTKEAHASKIIKVVSEYFLTQKIKRPAGKDKKAWKRYTELLAAHHLVMVRAMKAKQTVDPKVVVGLRIAVSALEVFWPGKKK